jgi:hypothetical protein
MLFARIKQRLDDNDIRFTTFFLDFLPRLLTGISAGGDGEVRMVSVHSTLLTNNLNR